VTFAEIGVKDGPATTPSSVADDRHKLPKYPYIDALRGYAVLLVILSHTGGMFPELPYPIKKFTNLGWIGVQLFFLVSCVTLMMSWRSDERKGIASPLRFWVRRFFRIAPMYYLAALFYLVAEPPINGFDLGQILATLTFINAWHPVLLSTVAGGWRVVPGGWSISVEFCFYILFPLVVAGIRTRRMAIIFSLFAMGLGCVANDAVRDTLWQKYGTFPTDTFLYFWLPNQLFVFAFGTLLFFAFNSINKGGSVKSLGWRATLLLSVCAVAIGALGELPNLTPAFWSLSPFRGPPQVFYITVLLFIIAVLVARNPTSILVNKAIRALGTVSFSAYIWHFFIVHQLADIPIINAAHRTGIPAIIYCGVLFVSTVLLTFGASWLTYRYVEKPMINFGAGLAARTDRRCKAA
jgi:peptidoglycan/LPS O-acetylase OafA/YrhL